MNTKSRKILEFDKVLSKIALFCVTEKAKQIILELSPFHEKGYIEELLNQVDEADKILYFHSLSPSFSVDNIERSLDKAAVMSVLSMEELLKISKALRISRNLHTLITK